MNLMQLFRGFIRNYASLQLHIEDRNLKKFTERELGYFARAGEIMGYYTFQEDKLEIKGKNRNLDLVWATYLPDIKFYNYQLHLEHEHTLSVEATLESKLSDIPNLVAINWAKPEKYSSIIKAAKNKFKNNPDVENILLIVKDSIKEIILLHAIWLSKKGKKIDIEECEGIVKKTEAGFLYGILKSEIEKKQWKKMISK